MQTQYLYFRNVLTTTLPPSKNFSANHAICITCFQIESYFLGDIVTTQSHYLYFRNVLATTLPQSQRLLREWCTHDTLPKTRIVHIRSWSLFKRHCGLETFLTSIQPCYYTSYGHVITQYKLSTIPIFFFQSFLLETSTEMKNLRTAMQHTPSAEHAVKSNRNIVVLHKWYIRY